MKPLPPPEPGQRSELHLLTLDEAWRALLTGSPSAREDEPLSFDLADVTSWPYSVEVPVPRAPETQLYIQLHDPDALRRVWRQAEAVAERLRAGMGPLREPGNGPAAPQEGPALAPQPLKGRALPGAPRGILLAFPGVDLATVRPRPVLVEPEDDTDTDTDLDELASDPA